MCNGLGVFSYAFSKDTALNKDKDMADWYMLIK